MSISISDSGEFDSFITRPPFCFVAMADFAFVQISGGGGGDFRLQAWKELQRSVYLTPHKSDFKGRIRVIVEGALQFASRVHAARFVN